MMGNTTTKEYVPDKRQEYIQAVKMMALAMFPMFDEQMKKDWESYETKSKKLRTSLADKDGFVVGQNSQKYSILLNELSQELFKNLSCLLHRLDYFKQQSYSEGELREFDYVEDTVDVDDIQANKKEEDIDGD